MHEFSSGTYCSKIENSMFVWYICKCVYDKSVLLIGIYYFMKFMPRKSNYLLAIVMKLNFSLVMDYCCITVYMYRKCVVYTYCFNIVCLLFCAVCFAL